MCLSNILYDVNSKSVKFIDPRGNFGKEIVYGDIKYDLAKLRHSFNGKYEFIISDLFKLTEINSEKFILKIYSDNYHELIKNKFDDLLKKYKYDLNTIKLIEALLFISMIPLHDGKINRQKVMYLKSILLLNETNL